MRTIVSLFLIALALYTVEALAASDANMDATGATETDLTASVVKPGIPSGYCERCADPSSGYVKDKTIEPSGAAAPTAPTKPATSGEGVK